MPFEEIPLETPAEIMEKLMGEMPAADILKNRLLLKPREKQWMNSLKNVYRDNVGKKTELNPRGYHV